MKILTKFNNYHKPNFELRNFLVSSYKKYHLNHIAIEEMSYTSVTIFENIGLESFEKHFGS